MEYLIHGAHSIPANAISTPVILCNNILSNFELQLEEESLVAADDEARFNEIATMSRTARKESHKEAMETIAKTQKRLNFLKEIVEVTPVFEEGSDSDSDWDGGYRRNLQDEEESDWEINEEETNKDSFKDEEQAIALPLSEQNKDEDEDEDEDEDSKPQSFEESNSSLSRNGTIASDFDGVIVDDYFTDEVFFYLFSLVYFLKTKATAQ